MTPGFTDTQWEQFLASIEGHTKGPWDTENQGPTSGYGDVANLGILSLSKLAAEQERIGALDDPEEEDPTDQAWVCGLWGNLTDEDRANAALIAAAPTLVEEVKRLRAENALMAEEIEHHLAAFNLLSEENAEFREAVKRFARARETQDIRAQLSAALTGEAQ